MMTSTMRPVKPIIRNLDEFHRNLSQTERHVKKVGGFCCILDFRQSQVLLTLFVDWRKEMEYKCAKDFCLLESLPGSTLLDQSSDSVLVSDSPILKMFVAGLDTNLI